MSTYFYYGYYGSVLSLIWIASDCDTLVWVCELSSVLKSWTSIYLVYIIILKWLLWLGQTNVLTKVTN